MALLRKLTILQRLILMLVLAAIGTLCFASFSIKEQYDNLITQKWLQNDAQLNTALSVVAAHRTQAQAGKLTLEEAQQESAALIGQMRYGREGYFILLSDQGKIIAHGAEPSLVGQAIAGYRIKDGSNPLAQLQQQAKANAQANSAMRSATRPVAIAKKSSPNPDMTKIGLDPADRHIYQRCQRHHEVSLNRLSDHYDVDFSADFHLLPGAQSIHYRTAQDRHRRNGGYCPR